MPLVGGNKTSVRRSVGERISGGGIASMLPRRRALSSSGAFRSSVVRCGSTGNRSVLVRLKSNAIGVMDVFMLPVSFIVEMLMLSAVSLGRCCLLRIVFRTGCVWLSWLSSLLS